MSLCDRCFAPGACCRGMNLTKASGDQVTIWDSEDPVEALTKIHDGEHWFYSLGKMSTWRSEEYQEDYSSHRWACSALGEDGRCTVYDRRPGLCRSFEAGSDPLCVHYRGAEAGEESAL